MIKIWGNKEKVEKALNDNMLYLVLNKQTKKYIYVEIYILDYYFKMELVGVSIYPYCPISIYKGISSLMQDIYEKYNIKVNRWDIPLKNILGCVQKWKWKH